MKLTVVIPCFNEEKSLKALLYKCEQIANSKINFLFVNNGSTDNTQEFLDKAVSNCNFFHSIKIDKNIGYGHGIISGLKAVETDLLGWTHADLQTDPEDIKTAYNFFINEKNINQLFIKGLRKKRPLRDSIFTFFMSIFETLLLRSFLWDINAQPTIFHKNFFNTLDNFPNDFSLDLFFLYMARKKKLKIKRFPVLFQDRVFGESSWNFSLKSKIKFIIRTINYSFKLIQNVNVKNNS